MWDLICRLPVEVIAIHILPMLGLKDLVAVDSSCVKKSNSWQKALQLMKPIKLNWKMMIHSRAVEWILRTRIHVSQFNCGSVGAGDGQLSLAERHPKLVKSVFLGLVECGAHGLQQVSQSILQKTVKLELEGIPTPAMVKAIMTGVKRLQRLVCTEAEDYYLVQRLVDSNPRLKSLSLHGHASLKGLRFGSNLTSLSFQVTHLTAKQATDIASTCRHLARLLIGVGYLGYHWGEAPCRDDLIVPFAEHCAELRSLTYLCFDITPTAVWGLARHCRRLREFKPPRQITAGEILIFALHHTPLRRVEFIDPLMGGRHQHRWHEWLLRRLRSAQLHPEFIESKEAVEVVRCMTNLRVIELDCPNWRMLPLLEGVAERCHNLVAIEIRHDASAVQEICRVLHYCRRLQEVALTCTTCVEVPRIMVLSLTQLGPRLRSLHLVQYVTHDAVMLPIIAANPDLRSLELSHIATVTSDDGPRLTDATVKALTHCRKLSMFVLGNGPKIAPEAVMHLARACRHLQCMVLPHDCKIPSEQLAQLKEDHLQGRRLHRVTITNALPDHFQRNILMM